MGGKYFALLVADRLAIDHEAALRVIAERMEETVAIGHHATGAIRDRLAQAATGIHRGKLHEQRAVRIDVSGGIHLDEVARAFHRNAGLGAGQGQCGLELDGNSIADGHVLREDRKAGCRHIHVIRIRRNITEPERAVAAGSGDLPVAGDRIVDGHGGVGHCGAGGINHAAFNGACVPQRLAKRGVENDCTHEERTQSEG